MPITITVKRDGPYRIEGDLAEVTLIDHDGTPISLEGRKGVSLCDGTHSKIGFKGAEIAARAFDIAHRAPSGGRSGPEGESR